jgi:uncharacterized membrane protein YheB (UPF0754 family)
MRRVHSQRLVQRLQDFVYAQNHLLRVVKISLRLRKTPQSADLSVAKTKLLSLRLQKLLDSKSRRHQVPFQSQAQRKYLHANNPKLAKEWEQKYPPKGKLPPKVKPSKPKPKSQPPRSR